MDISNIYFKNQQPMAVSSLYVVVILCFKQNRTTNNCV